MIAVLTTLVNFIDKFFEKTDWFFGSGLPVSLLLFVGTLVCVFAEDENE